MRSLINIANNIEFEKYTDASLGRVDRFVYLREQIMTQAAEVFELLIYFSKKKAYFREGEIEDFESRFI